jgi:choline-sulfatase
MYGFYSNLAAEFQNNYDFSVGKQVPRLLFDQALFDQSVNDNLDSKPGCQKSYRDSYRQFFQPILNESKYYRFYYQAHQNVDRQLARVYTALQQTRFLEDTIVVFTSDHGDLLGSHNGMHQKWYQTYDEVLRIPLIFSNPSMFPAPKSQTILTSHIDLLPTLLGLAGINAETTRQTLAESHTEARPLVGKNLAPVIMEQVNPATLETPVYFMTDDAPSRGQGQQNFIGLSYDSVIQPNHIECVVARIGGELWKYSRYFGNPQFWSSPGTPGQMGVNDVVVKPLGLQPNQPGQYVVQYQRTVKTAPLPDEFEMYNLSQDPMELHNLAGDPAHAQTEMTLRGLLSEQCTQKRLRPQSVNIPGQPSCS